MISLDDIKKPVAGEITRYEEYLRNSLHSDNELAGAMLGFIFNNRGKSIRPLLALLSASMVSGGAPLPQRSHLGAMLLEMVHTASLVHDDVIDESSLRRGKPSVNAVWNSHLAVIIGDFILARSFSAGMESGYYDIVSYVTRSIADLCEGELIQSDQSERLQMTREIYYEIIYKKTATLIGTSCGVGAMSVDAPDGEVKKLKEMGDNIGMAFQIKDDILDYGISAKTGKPVCIDLREKKITLPMITVMERSSDARRKQIVDMLAEIESRPQNADLLYEAVISEGGLEMAGEQMALYVDKARATLYSYPRSDYRDSLDNLLDYVIQREV